MTTVPVGFVAVSLESLLELRDSEARFMNDCKNLESKINSIIEMCKKEMKDKNADLSSYLGTIYVSDLLKVLEIDAKKLINEMNQEESK